MLRLSFIKVKRGNYKRQSYSSQNSFHKILITFGRPQADLDLKPSGFEEIKHKAKQYMLKPFVSSGCWFKAYALQHVNKSVELAPVFSPFYLSLYNISTISCLIKLHPAVGSPYSSPIV